MQLLLFQPGDAPVILLNREVVTQGDPFSIVLYGIILVPLEDELRDVYPSILSPFYANNAVFDGLARWSAAHLCLLMDWGPDQGYFPDPAKSLFIPDNLEDKETVRQ